MTMLCRSYLATMLACLALAAALEASGTLFGTAARTMWPDGSEFDVASQSQIFQRFFENDQSASNPTRLRMFKQSITPSYTYGFSRDFGMRLSMPFAYAVRSERGRGRQSFAGPEDWRLSAAYRLDPLIFGKPYTFKGGSFRLAAYATVRLPTAEDRRAHDPQNISFGHTSDAVRLGVSSALLTTEQYWWSEVSVTFDNEESGFQLGTSAKAHVAFGQRIWALKDHRGADLLLQIEGDLEHRDNGKVNGSHDPNSGFFAFHLAPGMQLNITNRWEIRAGYNIPVYRKVYGRQFVNEGTLALGVSYLF